MKKNEFKLSNVKNPLSFSLSYFSPSLDLPPSIPRIQFF